MSFVKETHKFRHRYCSFSCLASNMSFNVKPYGKLIRSRANSSTASEQVSYNAWHKEDNEVIVFSSKPFEFLCRTKQHWTIWFCKKVWNRASKRRNTVIVSRGTFPTAFGFLQVVHHQVFYGSLDIYPRIDRQTFSFGAEMMRLTIRVVIFFHIQ